MDKREVSLRELARRSHYDHGYLSRVVNGRAQPSIETAVRLDDVLDAGGTLHELATPGDTETTSDAEERLLSAARQPSRLDARVVESLAIILAEQRRVEDVIGSIPLVEPVRAQMSIVEHLVSDARGRLRLDVVLFAGQWAQWFGWLDASTGRLGDGDSWLDRALEWAIETGEPNLISEVLSFKGHVAWMAGRPGPVIGLSAAAQRDRDLYPGQTAISAAQEARGQAMLGDAYATDRLLDAADDLVSRS